MTASFDLERKVRDHDELIRDLLDVVTITDAKVTRQGHQLDKLKAGQEELAKTTQAEFDIVKAALQAQAAKLDVLIELLRKSN